MARNVPSYDDGRHRVTVPQPCPEEPGFDAPGDCSELKPVDALSRCRPIHSEQVNGSQVVSGDSGDGYGGGDDDVDSALGDDESDDGDTLSTVSLSESIMQYRVVNGRTYHSEKHGCLYWGPNDERSNEAEDIGHQVFLYLLDNKLFLAPLQRNEIRRVLDIGTGTGIWANDFADDFPGAEVIGTDISPIQPAWTAPNCRFEMEDAEQEWTFSPNSFDYIHMRTLGGSIQDWAKLFQQSYDTLRPGGWIETYETDCVFSSDNCELPDDSPLRLWTDYFTEAGKLMRRTFHVLRDNVQVEGIRAAGFENIEVVSMKSPVGSWPSDPKRKRAGIYAKVALEQDLEGYISFVWTHVLQKPIEEMHVYLASFRKALRAPNVHLYLEQRVVYARKPINAT